jgi:hypothetical protein
VANARDARGNQEQSSYFGRLIYLTRRPDQAVPTPIRLPHHAER